MDAAAVRFLVLGAATTASGERMEEGGAARSGADGLDQFADTVDRASFTTALDSLRLGLESVYEALRVDGSAR